MQLMSSAASDPTVHTSALLDRVDEQIFDLRSAARRPGYRARVLGAVEPDVDVGTVRVLRVIERATDAPGVGAIAESLRIDPSTASRLVDKALSSGFVTRTVSPTDRRRAVLALTPEGQHVLDEVTSARRALLAELTADWPHDELTQLAELLERLNAAFLRMERA